jgi:hypothetical protein
MFTQWVTSYFKHGDGFLSKRSVDALEYVVPSTARVPSIFNMTPEEKADIVSEGPNAAADIPFMVFMIPQLAASFRKAAFSPDVRALAPHMKVWFLTGDLTAAFGPAALWAVEDEDKAHGGGLVKTRVIEGTNHFVSCILCLSLHHLIIALRVIRRTGMTLSLRCRSSLTASNPKSSIIDTTPNLSRLLRLNPHLCICTHDLLELKVFISGGHLDD